MNLQELQNRTKYYRVLNSTYYFKEETKEMVGGEYEYKGKEIHVDGTKIIKLWNKDKSDFWYFYQSDVQELTPVEYKGQKIGIGDEVLWNGNWWEVYCYYWVPGAWVVQVAQNKEYSITVGLLERDIENLRPLYNSTPKETIEIGGKKYDKKEFETAVKDLKPVE